MLGAFLAGVLTTRVGTRAMIVGMMSGIAVLVWVWAGGKTAWTWYAFIGSAVTFLAAWLASFVTPRTDQHA